MFFAGRHRCLFYSIKTSKYVPLCYRRRLPDELIKHGPGSSLKNATFVICSSKRGIFFFFWRNNKWYSHIVGEEMEPTEKEKEVVVLGNLKQKGARSRGLIKTKTSHTSSNHHSLKCKSNWIGFRVGIFLPKIQLVCQLTFQLNLQIIVLFFIHKVLAWIIKMIPIIWWKCAKSGQPIW